MFGRLIFYLLYKNGTARSAEEAAAGAEEQTFKISDVPTAIEEMAAVIVQAAKNANMAVETSKIDMETA